METQQTFVALTSEFLNYLQQICRREQTIKRYAQLWGRVQRFMDAQGQSNYDKHVGEAYLHYLLGDYSYQNLRPYYKVIVNSVEALAEFQDTGTVLMGKRRKPPVILDGPVGNTMEQYIAYKKTVYHIKDVTVYNYKSYLHELLAFFNAIQVSSVSELTPSTIQSYVRSMRYKNIETKHAVLTVIKQYLIYLYQQELTTTDLSLCIPKANFKRQPHLPSTFSPEEIKALLTAIDRSNARGIRDYAILLLGAKLGLRASDLAGLRLEHILWHQNLIVFEQMKTRRRVELPLLPEIGNAIISYLKYSRPVSKDGHCFLQLIPPFRPLKPGSIGNIVRYQLGFTDIKIRGRKHGTHALRHSLAGQLLENKTPLTLISEVLGHADSSSTMYYLRIDLVSLRQCALDVPAVPVSFYEPKGGLTHG